MLWIIALGLVGTGLAGAFALALCRAAADGDRAAANFATTGDDGGEVGFPARPRHHPSCPQATDETDWSCRKSHHAPDLPPIRVPRGGVYHGKIDLDEIERYANQHGPSG